MGCGGDSNGDPLSPGDTGETGDASTARDAGSHSSTSDGGNPSSGTSKDAGSPSTGTQDAGNSTGSHADAGKPTDAATPVDASKPADAASTGNACDSLTYASFGQNFLSTYCTNCHSGFSAQRGVMLDSLANVQANKAAAKAAVSIGSMPPPFSFPSPSSAERQQFSQFIDCGPM